MIRDLRNGWNDHRKMIFRTNRGAMEVVTRAAKRARESHLIGHEPAAEETTRCRMKRSAV
jgi:hypothetical protein